LGSCCRVEELLEFGVVFGEEGVVRVVGVFELAVE
jgi:hypothetical protein